jgi:hypothetical protein
MYDVTARKVNTVSAAKLPAWPIAKDMSLESVRFVDALAISLLM